MNSGFIDNKPIFEEENIEDVECDDEIVDRDTILHEIIEETLDWSDL